MKQYKLHFFLVSKFLNIELQIVPFWLDSNGFISCFSFNCHISKSQTCICVPVKSTSCVREELSWGGGMCGEHLAHFSTVWAVILASRSCGNEIKLSWHLRKLSLTHSFVQQETSEAQRYKRLVTCYCAGWQLHSAGRTNRWREWRFDFCESLVCLKLPLFLKHF